MKCPACSNEFDMPAERCPHCAEPGLFSNVWAAQESDNADALELRYQTALAAAALRGCSTVVQDFLAQAARAKAVIAKRIHDVERLAYSDKEGYATYYQQIESQIRLPDGDEWDEFRRPADEALFPGYKEQIRFAALTLDGLGVLNYGDWSIVLRTPMVERRTSTFEENSLVFVKLRRVPIAEAKEGLRGFRAAWSERGKLCVAKLAGALSTTTKPGDFAGLLLEQGPPGKPALDRFVEAHIFGPLTIRTVERVTLKESRDTRRLASKSRRRAIERNLKAFGVTLEVQP